MEGVKTLLRAEIYFDKDELSSTSSLHEFIMKSLMDSDIRGATAFQGSLGFGKDHQLKKPNEIFSFDDPPMLIVFVDEETKVRKALSKLRKSMKRGFFFVSKVEEYLG